MTKLEKLIDWIRYKHDGQHIKKTSEPYFDHLVAVAEMVALAIPLGYEAGLCHDLLEKTKTDKDEFYSALVGFNYLEHETQYILNTVIELTDVFTKVAYPNLKKSERKSREEARCVSISPAAQTVKYADLIYNVRWMMKYDLKHAKKYLKRKQRLLALMAAGDPGLHCELSQLIVSSLATL